MATKVKKADNISDESTETAEQKPKKETGYVYPQWDLWSVHVKSIGNMKYEVTCLEAKMTGCKVETQTIDVLNSQTHNTGQRYYPAGEVVASHKETITIK